MPVLSSNLINYSGKKNVLEAGIRKPNGIDPGKLLGHLRNGLDKGPNEEYISTDLNYQLGASNDPLCTG